MPIKAYKPTSNGRRNMTALTKEEITTSTPEKSLLAPYKKKGGRNNMGQITTRHHGGGHKFASGVRVKTMDEAMKVIDDLEQLLIAYQREV